MGKKGCSRDITDPMQSRKEGEWQVKMKDREKKRPERWQGWKGEAGLEMWEEEERSK